MVFNPKRFYCYRGIHYCQPGIDKRFVHFNKRGDKLKLLAKRNGKVPTTDIRGQIYIPSINWVLCVGCFLVMLYFKTYGEYDSSLWFFNNHRHVNDNHIDVLFSPLR